MPLRDYIAVAAMQGLLTSHDQHETTLGELPAYAYKIADAMLAERKRT